MKLLLSSLLVLSVLAVGISQAEAYDGNIHLTRLVSEPTIGDVIPFEGYLSKVEPPENTSVLITLRDTDNSIIDSFQAQVDSKVTVIDEFTNVWLFAFEIDTSKYNLLTDTKYMIEATFEDKIEDKRLYVYPTLEQSIIDAGIAKSEREAMMIEKPIPEWVRHIFIFYANNEISDSELMDAIQYLIDIKILKA